MNSALFLFTSFILSELCERLSLFFFFFFSLFPNFVSWSIVVHCAGHILTCSGDFIFLC
jgi:ABC-type polysaccharide transport system permease subunit